MTLTEQLNAHRKKRYALEQLFLFARQLVVAGESMGAIQCAARPSQTLGAQQTQQLESRIANYDAINTERLKQELRDTDQLLSSELGDILKIAEISEQDFNAHFKTDSADTVNATLKRLYLRLQTFKARAQNNLAIRSVLHQRGMPVAAIKLPVSQELLADQVKGLRQKEKYYRGKIQAAVQSILTDTNAILQAGHYPSAINDKMAETQQQLQQTLDHLDKGGRLDQLPFTIELDLSDSDYALHTLAQPDQIQQQEQEQEQEPAELTANANNDTPPPASDTAIEEQNIATDGKPGFFYLLRRWLSTPSSVTWQDIKRQEARKSKHNKPKADRKGPPR